MSQANHLITHLVKTYYGEGYCWLIDNLLDSKELQLPDLAKSAPLSSSQLRSMLVVLLKNEIVEAVTRTVANQPITSYRLNLEACLALPLYPRLLALVEERFSFLGKSLAETLLINGKMSAKDCIGWTKDNIGMELEAFRINQAGAQGLSEDISEKDYVQELGGLINSEIIVPVHKLISIESGNEKDGGLSIGDTVSKSTLFLLVRFNEKKT